MDPSTQLEVLRLNSTLPIDIHDLQCHVDGKTSHKGISKCLNLTLSPNTIEFLLLT